MYGAKTLFGDNEKHLMDVTRTGVSKQRFLRAGF